MVADWCTILIGLHWIYDQWRWSKNLCTLLLGCYPFPPVLHPLSLPCLLSPTPSPPGMTSFFFHPPPCTSPSSFSSSPPLTLPLFFLLAHFFSVGFLKKDCDKRALKINDRSDDKMERRKSSSISNCTDLSCGWGFIAVTCTSAAQHYEFPKM